MPNVLINNFPTKGLSTKLESTCDLVRFLSKIPQADRMQWVRMPDITALIQLDDIYGAQVYTVKWKKSGENKIPNTVYLQLLGEAWTLYGEIYGESGSENLEYLEYFNSISQDNQAVISNTRPSLFRAAKDISNQNFIRFILEKTFQKKLTSLHGTRLTDFADLLKLLPEENWQEVVALYKPTVSSIVSWPIDEQAVVLHHLVKDFKIDSTLPVGESDKFSVRLQHLGIDQVSTELAIAWYKLWSTMSNDIFKRCVPTLERLASFLSQWTPGDNAVFIAHKYFMLDTNSILDINASYAAVAKYLEDKSVTISREQRSIIITGYVIAVAKSLKTKNECDAFRALISPFIVDIDVMSCLKNAEVPNRYEHHEEVEVKVKTGINMLVLLTPMMNFNNAKHQEKLRNLVEKILYSVADSFQKKYVTFKKVFNDSSFSDYIREKIKDEYGNITSKDAMMVLNICAAIIQVRDAVCDGNYLPTAVGENLYIVVQEAFQAWKGNRRAAQHLEKIREALDVQYAKQSSSKMTAIDFEEKMPAPVLNNTSLLRTDGDDGLDSNAAAIMDEEEGAIPLTVTHYGKSQVPMYSNTASGGVGGAQGVVLKK